MSGTAVRLAALELRRVRDTEHHPGWALIRAENAPVAAAILGTYLAGDVRRRPAAELAELVESELDELREAGFDLPRTAHAYLAEWRAQGLLIRRAADESRTETYELTAEALGALRFLDQLRTPRQAATQSRLATISAALRSLAVDSDPDVTVRLTALEEERARLDERIARLRSGEEPVVDRAAAIERARDVVQLAEEVPADFARVRTELDGVNRSLRESILDGDTVQGRVLAEVFRGVDLIAESNAGRTFAAFAELVLDAEAGAAFADAVGQVLDREFARELSPAQRRFLRGLLPALVDASLEVQVTMAAFARSLRRFVHSQDYLSDRVLRRELTQTLAAALPAAATTRPWAPSGIELSLTSVPLASVGAIQLYDPQESEVSGDVEVHEDTEVDLDALRALARETEIDMAELRAAVNDALAFARDVTIAEVLDRHGATQGVASVVGLLALAARHGVAHPEARERVEWTSVSGVPREARIPVHTFTGRVP
ncbi:DUF3375 domain-containing protein [Miniimonas arenae]|nr:DUF3375 domain-containing protein [Miniimonas arenae]